MLATLRRRVNSKLPASPNPEMSRMSSLSSMNLSATQSLAKTSSSLGHRKNRLLILLFFFLQRKRDVLFSPSGLSSAEIEYPETAGVSFKTPRLSNRELEVISGLEVLRASRISLLVTLVLFNTTAFRRVSRCACTWAATSEPANSTGQDYENASL